MRRRREDFNAITSFAIQTFSWYGPMLEFFAPISSSALLKIGIYKKPSDCYVKKHPNSTDITFLIGRKKAVNMNARYFLIGRNCGSIIQNCCSCIVL